MLSDTVIKSRAIIVYNEEKSTLLNLIIGSIALKIYIYVAFLIEHFSLKDLSF